MMREQLRQRQEFQELAGDTGPQVNQTREAETVTEAVEPVISLEKSDIEFWLTVLQVVLLYLILRELQGGSV